jgi:hypothetical protein
MTVPGGFPFRAYVGLQSREPVARAASTSRGVELTFSVFVRGGIALLVQRSLYAVSIGPEVFPTATTAPEFRPIPFRSWTCSLLQSLAESDCHRTSQQQLSWGLVPFSDVSSGGPVNSGLPRPTPSGSRVSRPLAGFRPPEPSGPVSCRYRSWGFPSGPLPPAEPSIPLGTGDLRDVGRDWKHFKRTRSLPPAEPSPSRLCSLRGFATFQVGVNRLTRPLPSWFFDL